MSGAFVQYRNDTSSTSLRSNFINDIDVSSDSRLWLATGGGGLELFNPITNEFTHYVTIPEDTNSISNDLVNVVLEEAKDTVWLGFNNNGGVDRFSPQTGRFHHYLPGLSIFDILKDRQGRLWVGSQNGLYHYNKENDEFSQYFGENMDLSLNTIIYSIIDDDQNNLWVGTPLGIYKVDHQSGNMILYGDENGVNGDFLFYNSVYQQAEGKILFGYFGGYLEIYPDKLTVLPGTSSNYFVQFWINDTEVHSTSGSPFTKSIMFSNEIVLDYDQNVFSIGSASIDFRATEDKRIYYMLENYENDWRTAAPGERANYFKVPPGKYTFRIKSINSNNGSWSEESIAVQISPPWWLSWWAYAGYGLIFIAGVFIVDRFQRKRLIEKERERMKDKELAQAREIEKAYNDLKITQKQLIQSEKMASLGELTAGIAHEIQNPLNFVNNFADVSADLVDEMNEEMTAGNVEDARDIGKDLKDNLDKITHHGQRASSIVKGMLQHSRASDGKKEPTDINALADEYLRLAYHGLRAKDKSFNADFKLAADESLAPISVVPQDMGRVLLNLINNAFQSVYARKQEEPEGYQPTVEVVTLKTPSSVEIRVKDNGGGIPEDILEKIFQPFFTTKSSGDGTGLGLSLSYDIVHKGHGGELKVESKEGIGTEFIVILPSN
jgi:signal transduction histidine kinase